MSLEKEDFLFFIDAIADRPNLLSTEDWTSLEELLPTISDDLEELLNEIANWCKSRPAIVEAIEELSDSARGAKNRPTKPSGREVKKIIENKVRQEKPNSKPSKSKK